MDDNDGIKESKLTQWMKPQFPLGYSEKLSHEAYIACISCTRSLWGTLNYDQAIVHI